MALSSIDVSTVPVISHREAAGLATTEYERFLGLIRSLEPADWSARTDCPEWDVRSMVAHVLGTAEAHGSIRENAHQMRLARTSDRPLVDALGVVQIAERASLSPHQLIERLERAAPRSVRMRRRAPALVRAVRIKVEMPFGTERWRLGYLMDRIYTRDAFMHRVDITRAVGREDLELTLDHDGRIVADIIAEWARRHGQPFSLELTGPAGGRFVAGAGGPDLQLDAVEAMRILSGRASGEGLFTTPVPF